ncbi:flagellar biosynthesis anti-sigma factor FlgM [Sphingomonas sp. 37zxx]|uniref:flagellar biosynthesis anti-sigma factor FlgM n=1 Tax=Sphingomonas sp. 37zxx TaxID=1550073 RepID=UPI000AA6525E|nr:flagellar biosynthesis anti-sigma factor FlgM [Sphingomonas sp. 37zxx]
MQRIAAVGAAARANDVQTGPDPKPADAQAGSLSATISDLASKPPIDAERIARIRRAVKDGTFPISPATIADRMLALKLNWKPNDPA